MKKKLLLIITLAVVLILPFSVFAATSDTPAAKAVRGFFGIDISTLSDEQKADVKDYSQKMADLQKEFINKMVTNGTMTKEQGDAAVKRIDEVLENSGGTAFLPGFGTGRKVRKGQGGLFLGGIDPSTLTGQQKADLTDSFKKAADLHKEYVNKAVASGMLTKEQGDAALKRIDEASANLQADGMYRGFGMFMGGFYGIGPGRTDESKLADQQKADLTEFRNKMTDLHKETINKMVSNGALTKEQGDAAIKRIEEMKDFKVEKGFEKGRGRMGGKGKWNAPDTNSTSPASGT